MRCWLVLLAGLAWAGCAGTRPAWLPDRPCGPGQDYDYARDARPTPNGNEGYAGYASRAKRRDCHKRWTLLIYMAADNDLAPYAYLNLYEMEAGYRGGERHAGSTDATDVVVQLDTPTDPGGRRLHVFQTPEPYDERLTLADFTRRSERDIRSPVVARPPPAPGAAAALTDFLTWGIRAYPAEHYLVIVWGHGEGWAPAAAQARLAGKRFGGIAFDQSQDRYLDIPALRGALRAAGDLLGGRPIDVYASDACLMQSMEVASELSGTARFIVGSTQVENYFGLPYRELLYEINRGRPAGDEAERLARLIPRVFGQAFAPGGARGRLAPGMRETFTLSALSSATLTAELLPALGGLARALRAYLAADLLHAADIHFVLKEDPGYLGGTRDLGIFLDRTRRALQRRAPAQGLLQAIDQTARALDRTVVAFVYGSDYADRHGRLLFPSFRAASVWLPPDRASYLVRIEGFSSSRFFRSLRPWEEMLGALYSRGP